MVGDLYQEGFVDCEELVIVPGLQVLLPLVVLMENFALEGFSLGVSLTSISSFCLFSYFCSCRIR